MQEDVTEDAVADRRIIHAGNDVQNCVLYHIVCMYEKERRKWLSEHPVVSENVVFFNQHNERTPGIVSKVLKPTAIDEPVRFNIDISTPGSKSDQVLRYKNVNWNRVERRQKYFACDPDWLAYAARATGFEESEVKATRVPHDNSPRHWTHALSNFIFLLYALHLSIITIILSFHFTDPTADPAHGAGD